MDEFFLDRIAQHVCLLEKMRETACADGHESGPVVVVTNWQYAEEYPEKWVERLKELITDSRFPEPMYLETNGCDEAIESLLLALIRNDEHVLASTPVVRASTKSDRLHEIYR